MNKNYPIQKLNHKQFADALQKGLGRARLHAIHFGIEGVKDLVLKACLDDNVCECGDGKAEYLLAMFRNTANYPEFKKKILCSVKTKRNTNDIQLLIQLLLQMAVSGDVEARSMLKEKALGIAGKKTQENPDKVDDGWLGAREWITLTGLDGVIELARIYGKRLLKYPEKRVPGDEIFPDEDVKKAFFTSLASENTVEPELLAYKHYLEDEHNNWLQNRPLVSSETARNRRKQEIRQRLNLDNVIYSARNKLDQYGVRYMRFGWAATQEELEILYSYLLSETDNDVIWRLLRVFTRVPLPGLDDRLFQLATSSDLKIKSQTIHALSHTRDEKVHTLGRAMLLKRPLRISDFDSIELFINNYEHEDSKLIISALNRIHPHGNNAFSISYDIRDLCEKNRDVGLTGALIWAYEYTTSSNCRFQIVKLLDSLGELKGRILYECQFDAEEDIVQLARKISPI
jgi:hypothetical protein